MKKLFTSLLALLAFAPFFTAKADWVKNVTLANYDFTLATTFTTANSNLSGNNTSGATTVPLSGATGGYMYSAGSGSGGRGTKITNITATTARQDTVYYEFDWNPYRLQGISAATGTANNDPSSYGVCIVRGSNDSIVFGLWYDRWSMKAGTNYNTSTGTQPLGDIHLMNISNDVNNPIPAKVITQTNPNTLVTWSYYTNTLLPFAMLDQNYSTNNYAFKCDSINQSTDLGPTFKMCNWYHIKAVIDFKNKNIISFNINLVGSTEVARSFTNLPFVNLGAQDVSRLEIAGTRGKAEGGTGNGSNCDFQQQFDNFDIYTMHQVAAAANVNVKYQDESGTELKTSRVAENIEIGTTYKTASTDKINIIYGGDYYLYDQTSVDSLIVQAGTNDIILKFKKATPLATKLEVSAPTTSELYKDVTINFTAKTTTNDIISSGTVNVLVNGNVKNAVTPDAVGGGSVTFPNLLTGTNTIKLVYVGDRISYSSSDTISATIEVAPTTSNVVAYPVYYDLGTMPEIMKYRLVYASNTSVAGHSGSISFAGDSLKSVVLSTDTTTLTKTVYTTWSQTALNAAPGKTADYYASSDKIDIPYGNGARASWMQFSTPWLNKGGYNVYLNQRTNTGGMLTTVTMDNKSLYYPNAELNAFYIRGNGNNNGRRWDANTNDGLNQMAYLGSVNLDASGVHTLKFTCPSTTETSGNQIAWLDMIEFIPIDQDSLTINIPAKTGLSKVYYPLFNSGGYALTATASFATYGSVSELSIPYQVTDPTTYEKTSYTLQHLGVTDPNLGLLGVDYVIIFKNDKWTRVAEGAVNTSDSTFTCELPNGSYYYQEYNYTENSLMPGSLGTRNWIKDGSFSIGDQTAVKNTNSSTIKTYVSGKTLTVKGIKSGAKITMTDLMGKVVLNTISNSDVFTTSVKQGSIYIVKVVSGTDTKTSKVIIK